MRVGGENNRSVIGDGDGILVMRGGQVVVGVTIQPSEPVLT